ncbi:P-loop containing nucleoside triphosphate hydrolase protein, partial [Mycena pura]
RRKPTSTTQKKAAVKLKRAIKRGDLQPPEQKQNPRRTHRRPLAPVSDAVQSSRKLQSAFVKLPAEFLEQTKTLAAKLPLTRPIPSSACRFPSINFDVDAVLHCPRRPKWTFDMTKKEVERNEEGIFRKWLDQTDQLVGEWQNLEITKNESFRPPSDTPVAAQTPRWTTFERNLEVWRQLWRVTEISQILLVLLDSRAPLLHYPPSLETYLSDRRIILVLTKVDIAGPARVDAWTRYFNARYPGLKVVQVESYIEKEMTSVHQGRKQHQPHIPETFRTRLVQAIREEHAAMLEPPEKVRANPSRLANWKPKVKRDIDWNRVMSPEGEKVGTCVGGPTAPHDDDAPEDSEEPMFFTIGLIGQPNVGKSSLLNALFGTSKVRASKTPGKTKHFQTLFWTPDVRLVDCPGLVMPNFVPLELQVLSGILPISRVSAVPFCIHYAAGLLPLERIYRIPQPDQMNVVDKRTWRHGEPPGGSETKEKAWMAMDILVGYADAKGWVTAKGGRPDVHRAGNAILRALAEGRVRWAFWPPDTNVDLSSDGTAVDGVGIWMLTSENGGTSSDEESEEDLEEDIHDSNSKSGEESTEESIPEGSEEEKLHSTILRAGTSRFQALQDMDGVAESSGSSEGEHFESN